MKIRIGILSLIAMSMLVLASSAFAASATEVSGQDFNTCAVTSTGGLKCWGLNDTGQLGDGTTTDSSTPVDVSGLTSGVAAVTLGAEHACALTTAGGVKCWGGGGLGDGTTDSSTTPVDVTGLTSGVAAVSAGGNHTCAVTTSGGLKCWGFNAFGQLGDGTTTLRLSPVNVTGLTSGVAAVSSFGIHTCAVTTSGGLKCWGRNFSGQLGDGTTTQSTTPVDVTGLTSGVAAVALGDIHTCALTTAGGLKCWGSNANGKLGDGTTTNRSTPVNVTGLTSGVAAVAAGGIHTCAVTTAGGLKCWGSGGSGQLGDGLNTNSSTAVDVTGLTSGIVGVGMGWDHTCAVPTAGGLQCWGSNEEGQLGDGTTTARSTAVSVSGFEDGDLANLSMAKSPHLVQRSISSSLTYTLTVTNNGPDSASDVTVTDTLPGAVTFVSASGGCGESGGTVTCTAASLANGASVPFTVTVTAPGTAGTVFSNTASVTLSGVIDPDTSDNSATAQVTAVNPPSVPGLTTWGLVALALGLGTLVVVGRRRRAAFSR